MSTLIIDIETVGENWEEIDETTQKILLDRYVKHSVDLNLKEEEVAKAVKNQLGLQPFTGKIITIGALELESKKSVIWYDPNGEKHQVEEEGKVKYIPSVESEMLEAFWKVAVRFNTFVTFSGRGMDMPFLMLRSAINKIRPTKDLMRARYLYQQSPDAKHIDLYEQLSFYGAIYNRNGGLHLACRAFGIESPKSDGIEGSLVGEFFRAGKTKEIAQYNARDLVSTAKLFEVWQKYLSF